MLNVTLYNGSTYEVANPALAKNMNAYAKADKQERQGQWLKAYSIATVIAEKLYAVDNDFANVDNFLDVMQVAKKTAQKYVRAVTFKESNKDIAGIDFLTINSVDALSGIDNLPKFMKWLASKKNITTFDGISESKLLELKKEWQEKTKANKKAEKETETEETEETETETKEIEYVVISYNGKKYKLDKAILETLEEVK